MNPSLVMQELGSIIKLICVPSDNTSPVGWLKNNCNLNENDDGVTFLPNNGLKHILFIANASIIHHNSTYTCGLNKSGVLIQHQHCHVYIRKYSHTHTHHTHIHVHTRTHACTLLCIQHKYHIPHNVHIYDVTV